MNEICWNTVGVAAAASFLCCLLPAAVLPCLKPRLRLLGELVRRNPARLAAFGALAAALAAYGGTKRSIFSPNAASSLTIVELRYASSSPVTMSMVSMSGARTRVVWAI